MTNERIREQLSLNGIPYGNDLPEKINIYLRLLKEWNERMDLTAVTDDEEMLDRHFMDSLAVLKTDLIPEGSRMIDVGTGAGFPGLVLALARDDLRMTLLDAMKKRLSFLETVIRETGAEGSVTLIHARAEDAGRNRNLREKFDLAAARALAPLNVLSEYLLPFVRIGGRALCWKGPALRDEAESGEKAVRLLGGSVEPAWKYTIAGREWEHMILPVMKTGRTPGTYPRKAGTPKSAPLGI